jgi:NhaC family Na+:H+ antiporter
VGGTATPTAALIPWNSCGAYMAATRGVVTWSCAPYAIYRCASPLLAIALTFAGFRMFTTTPAGVAPLAALAADRTVEPGPR